MFCKVFLTFAVSFFLAHGACADEPLTVNPTAGPKPLRVFVTGPAFLLAAISQCTVAAGWKGKGDNGLSINWGDGTDELGGLPLGMPCDDIERSHAFLRPDTYHIVITMWHPGPTNAPINDWTGLATVTVR